MCCFSYPPPPSDAASRQSSLEGRPRETVVPQKFCLTEGTGSHQARSSQTSALNHTSQIASWSLTKLTQGSTTTAASQGEQGGWEEMQGHCHDFYPDLTSASQLLEKATVCGHQQWPDNGSGKPLLCISRLWRWKCNKSIGKLL